MRRRDILGLAAALALVAWAQQPQNTQPEITVYKSPT